MPSMQLHELKPIRKRKKPKRVGRGGKRGAYSGRGMKGQKSRAGRRLRPAIRDLIKRYPKLRGYRIAPMPGSGLVVNLEVLDKKFDSKEKISPKSLLEKKIIRKIKGKTPLVKILGKGEITKALIVENCFISEKAKEKIEKAGGKVYVVSKSRSNL